MDHQVEDGKNINGNRYGSGMKAGLFGVISNVLLFAAKFVVGLLLRSITVVADALNNLSDGASSVVTVVGYRIASRPADKEHPFGHARFEYVAALVISVIMLVVGALFLKESITTIFSPHALADVQVYAYVVLGVSALVKGGQAGVYLATYRKTHSLPMKAAATDSIWDVVTTLTALLSTLLFDVTGWNGDGYFGALISVFIIVSSVLVLRDSVHPLLGDAPSESLVQSLRDSILSYTGVLGVHDIVLHSYGADHTYAIAHVEVRANETLTEAHELIDRIEREVRAETGIMLVVHVDPITDDFAAATRLRTEITDHLSEKYHLIAIHDFRVTKKDERLQVYFDAEVPWKEEITAEEMAAFLHEKCREECEYIITIDKE